jgi:hypothetical protein
MRRLGLCQVSGPLYYSVEAKLCPTVKLIAAVCRTALAVCTARSRSGIARQRARGTSLAQWRNSSEGATGLCGSARTESSTSGLVVLDDKSYPRNRPWGLYGSEILRTAQCLRQVSSQMAVRLSALRTGSTSFHRNIFLFLVLISVRG